MAHDNFLRMINQSLDGQLDAPDQTQLVRHIDECAACKIAWDSMNTLHKLFGPATMVSPTAGFSKRVMKRVQTHRSRSRQLGVTLWWMATVVVIGLMLLQPSTGSESLLQAVPEPLANAIQPALDKLSTLGGTLSALREALHDWFDYIASMPGAWIAALTTLALSATWLGLIGVLMSGPEDSDKKQETTNIWQSR